MESSTEIIAPVIRVTKYRWITLAIFCLYAAINFAQFLQYTIIFNIVLKYYKVESVLIDLSGLLFMISTIVFCAPSIYMNNKYDLRTISLLSSGLTTIGNLLKLASVSTDRYYVVLVSQFVCSLGQVLLFNIPTKLAAIWFGSNEVSTACAIAIIGTQVGIAIGVLAPSLFLPNTDTARDIEHGLWFMHITNSAITFAIFLIVCLFFRSKPEFPPNLSQVNKDDENSVGVLESFKILIKNPNYIWLALSFGLSNGIYSFLGIILNQYYLNYFPDSEQDIGLISFLSVLLGAGSGSCISGYLLDRFHRYKLCGYIATFVPIFILVLIQLTMEYQIKWPTYLLFPLFSLFLGSCLVIGFEFGTEESFPLSEVISCSVLNAIFYLFGIIFTFVFGALFDTIGYRNVMIINGVLLIISIILLYFIKPTLKRSKANSAIE